MSQALYRKYRSRSLDEVLGQEHVTSILRAALKQGKIAHAYLLTGPRGVGKTSVARILAHEINGLSYNEDATHLDIIEIDAASNNGVDDIRSLREKARVAPVSAAKKIYIIDEVHMLSKPAFNALLKTLEEPPAHVVFILATTDADKLPATILSRVQQFYFHPISSQVMAKQLAHIAKSEGFAIEPEAATLIAEHSRGGFRDAISLLDQLSPLAHETALTAEMVAAHLGLSGQAILDELILARTVGDALRALEILRELEANGTDPIILARQLMQLARQKLITQPELVELIAELIDVTRHPHPDLKLLTIFVSSGAETASSTAAATGTLSPASRTPQTSEAAHKEHSGSNTVSAANSENNSDAASTNDKTPKKPAATEPAKTADAESAAADKKPSPIQEFDWQKLLADIKPLAPGRYNFLAKSGYDFTDGQLTIYAGTKLAAAKLDDAKFRPQLAEIAEKIAGTDIEIITKPNKKPPKNAQLAEIAAMMGGGEEVKLEELS